MDQSPQPIKRSKELTPLSKEHHEGLLFGWKIKQGLRNNTDHNIISHFIQWFWKNDLQKHFRKEEEVLASRLPADNELVQQMFSEHKAIETLISTNNSSANKKVFLEIADLIHDHIRFEERVLFPFAEEFIPVNELTEIHGELATAKPKAQWENEFWLRKK